MNNTTDYEWLTEMGLCHRCRKEKTATNKKYCYDCLEKIRKENSDRYNPEYARSYKKRRREIYEDKKDKGICVRCTKPATHGLYCYEHYIKERRRSMERAKNEKEERNERGLIPEERKRNGLCLWCGENAVNGTNACDRHMLIFQEAGRKSKKNEQEVKGIWKIKKSKNLGSI